MQQESILPVRPNVPIRLENTGAFLVQSQSVSRGISFPWNQCDPSALCGFFLKRRMAAYFNSFRMNLQRMPSRHETTYPHKLSNHRGYEIYASPFTIYAQSQAKCLLSSSGFSLMKRQRGVMLIGKRQSLFSFYKKRLNQVMPASSHQKPAVLFFVEEQALPASRHNLVVVSMSEKPLGNKKDTWL